MNAMIRRRVMGWVVAVFTVAGTVGLAQAQTTLYWGGGTTNRIGGSTPLYPTNGNWDTVTANWGDLPTGTPANYYAWSNAGGNTASFGARTAGQTVTIPTATNIMVGGLSTYVFDGSGNVNLVGAWLTISPGATINVATGTALMVGGGGSGISLTSSTFTVTGGGRVDMTMWGGTLVSLPGTITVSNAMLTTSSDPSHWPFANATLNVSGPGSVYDNNRNDDWEAAIWQGIAGTGTIQPLPTDAAGLHVVCLNINVDTNIYAQLANGTAAGLMTVLYKKGSGTLTVMNTNSSYFGNYVRQGLLSSGAANALKGWVLVDGSSTATGIFGTSDSNFFAGGAVTADSGGQINGANLAVSQYQLMAGGAVMYNALSEIPGTGRVLNGAQKGAVIAGGYAFEDSFLQRIQESFDGVIALGTNIGSGTTLHFDGAGGNFTKARLGAWGAPRTFDGTLVPNGGAYRLGGGNNTLTLTVPLQGTGSLDVSDGPNKGFFGQTSFAPNGIILTANNTLSGPVTVGNGTTLSLSNANGRLSGATSITITGGGALTLADGATTNTSNGDRIPSVGVVLRKSGTLRFTGQGNTNYVESVGPLTIDGGCSTVSSARGSGTSASAQIQFFSITPTNWGTANFAIGGNSQIGFVTAPAANGALLGPWAIVQASMCFAAYQTNNNGAVIAATQTNVNSAATWQTCGSNANVAITGSFTASVPGSVGSLGLNVGGTIVWTGTNTLNTGGVIVNGSGTASAVFTNGQWTSATPDHGLYLYNFDQYGSLKILTVYSDIIDNGAVPVSLVVGGSAGTIVVSSSNNTFSGDVIVNAATLRATHANALGTGTNLILNGLGATLEFNGSDARTNNKAITVNADATVAGVNSSPGNTTLNGDITLNNDSLLTLGTYSLGRPVTVNGVIKGAGSLRLRGQVGVPLTLQGTDGNTYTGDTIISGHVVLNKSSGNAIPGDAYLGTVQTINNAVQRPMILLAQNNQIANTSTVIFGGGVAGTNTANLSPALRLSGKSDEIAGLNSLVGNGIVENGSNTTVSTLTLSGSGSYSYGGLIWNGSGGTQALVWAGTGTQTLAGASSYSGGTIVSNGTLLVRNTTGSGTGSGIVAVGAGGTLGGDGRISSNVIVNSGGTLAAGTPDNPTGLLTIGGNLVTTNGSTLAVTVSSVTNSTIRVTGNVTLGGALTIASLNYHVPDNTFLPILIATTGTISGKFTTVTDGYSARVSTNGTQLLLSSHRQGFIFSAQ